MDLIQVGVSVTGSKKKNPLRQSQGEPGMGLAAAAAGRCSLHLYMIAKHKFGDVTKFRIITSNKLENPRRHPFRHPGTGYRCCFAHSSQNFFCFSFISSTIVLESFPHLHPALFFRQSSVFLRNRTLIWTSCPIAVVLCSSKCYLQTVLDHSLFFHTNPLVLGFRRRVRRDDAIHEC
jgi:hypothetical protein